VPSLLRQCHEKEKISKAKVSPYSQLDGEASYFFHITKDLLFWDYLQKRLGFDVLFTAFQ